MSPCSEERHQLFGADPIKRHGFIRGHLVESHGYTSRYVETATVGALMTEHDGLPHPDSEPPAECRDCGEPVDANTQRTYHHPGGSVSHLDCVPMVDRLAGGDDDE